jgi:small subunit ribosomal protein S17e
MDRVRRISEELLDRFPDGFGTDFQKNKERLDQLAVVRSKMLKNRIAGYITKALVKKESEEAEQAAPEEESQ